MTLNCGTLKGFQSQGRSVEVKTSGRWETLGFGHSRLSYALHYGVDCTQGGSCWATEDSAGTGIVANRDYRPIRYQNYQQFALDPMQSVQRSVLLLPQSTPKESGSFRAILMLDGVHGRYGASVPLQCHGELVSSFSSTNSENALAELSRADRIIQDDFGFKQLRLQTDDDVLQKQIDAGKAGPVSVSAATQLALAVILDDFETIEAPLNIAAHGWASTYEQNLTGELNADQKEASRRFLREQMQSPKTTFALYLGKTIKGQSYPPEQGESDQDNWVFVLYVPSLSDHLYWVIVDRQGKVAPYLYGFN